MNSVNLIGNLTRDPELKYTAGKGTAICKINLAVRRDKDNTDFPQVVIWGKAAETVATYCSKGSKIGVEGSIRTGSYDGKDGKKVYTTEVHCLRVDLLDKKGQSESKPQPSGDTYEDMENVSDDTIPF